MASSGRGRRAHKLVMRTETTVKTKATGRMADCAIKVSVSGTSVVKSEALMMMKPKINAAKVPKKR